MNWRAGYPNEFQYLDDEHEELARMIGAMRNEAEAGRDLKARTSGMRILQKFKEHAKNEEEIMRGLAFPDHDLHENHHQLLIATLETILKLFDHGRMVQHGSEVARHIESRLAEEILVDRSLAQFLTTRVRKRD
jgi:hemerythrin-like metal-binding protein